MDFGVKQGERCHEAKKKESHVRCWGSSNILKNGAKDGTSPVVHPLKDFAILR